MPPAGFGQFNQVTIGGEDVPVSGATLNLCNEFSKIDRSRLAFMGEAMREATIRFVDYNRTLEMLIGERPVDTTVARMGDLGVYLSPENEEGFLADPLPLKKNTEKDINFAKFIGRTFDEAYESVGLRPPPHLKRRIVEKLPEDSLGCMEEYGD